MSSPSDSQPLIQTLNGNMYNSVSERTKSSKNKGTQEFIILSGIMVILLLLKGVYNVANSL